MPERTDSGPSYEGFTVERGRGCPDRVAWRRGSTWSTGIDDQRCAGLEWAGCYGLGAVWGGVWVYLDGDKSTLLEGRGEGGKSK